MSIHQLPPIQTFPRRHRRYGGVFWLLMLIMVLTAIVVGVVKFAVPAMEQSVREWSAQVPMEPCHYTKC